MMEHSQPARHDTPPSDRDTSLSEKPYGTWLAETIRASGRVRRANRPDTRLLLTSAKSISEKSCYAGAIHTGHLSKPRHRNKQPIPATCMRLSIAAGAVIRGCLHNVKLRHCICGALGEQTLGSVVGVFSR